ncbi:MAG: M1 family aminopeptidase, partial [Phycisphaerales bacterium]|nr:M1 family aminopeptidase [Phycisphaerales bacterium]
MKPSWRIDVAIADYAIVRDDPFKVFCFKKDEAGGRRVLKALQDTLALYSKWFGPLRGTRGFTLIEIPDGWGSQTDVTSITQTAAAFQSDEGVPELYHEVAHLWNVASRDAAPCRVESEGFATFMQYMAQEYLQDKRGAIQANADRFIEQLRGTYERDPRLAAVPMIRYGEEKLTDHSYTKGMVFFALLHALIGKDAFHRIVGAHYEKHAESGATSDEFFNTCRSIGAEKVDRLIDEWIYGERASERILKGMTFQQLVDLYRGS